MENRYLFRGKRIDTGEWVFGDLVHSVYKIGDTCVGQYGNEVGMHEVDQSTICRSSGLVDKTGELIFENDIVKDLFSDTAAPIRYGSYQNSFDSTKAEHVGFYVDWSGKYNKNYRKDLGYWIHMVDAELIGNTIDNPELLEV